MKMMDAFRNAFCKRRNADLSPPCGRKTRRLHLFSALVLATCTLSGAWLAQAASDTGGPVWTLDLASKTMKNPDPVALSESAHFTLKPIGVNLPGDMIVVFTDRKTGKQLAYTQGLVGSTNFSNAASGSIALNNDEMKELFKGIAPYGEIQALVTIWNTNANRMVAQDFVRVLNNPMVTTWTGFVPTEISNDIGAYISAMNDNYDAVTRDVASLRSGLETETNRAIQAESGLGTRIDALETASGNYGRLDAENTWEETNTFDSIVVNGDASFNDTVTANQLEVYNELNLDGDPVLKAQTPRITLNNVQDDWLFPLDDVTDTNAWTTNYFASRAWALFNILASSNALRALVDAESVRATAAEENISSNVTAVSNAFAIFVGDNYAQDKGALWEAITNAQGSLTGLVYKITVNGADYWPTNDDGAVVIPNLLLYEDRTNFVRGIAFSNDLNAVFGPDTNSGYIAILPPYPSTNGLASTNWAIAAIDTGLLATTNWANTNFAKKSDVSGWADDISDIRYQLWAVEGIVSTVVTNDGVTITNLGIYFTELANVKDLATANSNAIAGIAGQIGDFATEAELLTVSNRVTDLESATNSYVLRAGDTMTGDLIVGVLDETYSALHLREDSAGTRAHFGSLADATLYAAQSEESEDDGKAILSLTSKFGNKQIGVDVSPESIITSTRVSARTPSYNTNYWPSSSGTLALVEEIPDVSGYATFDELTAVSNKVDALQSETNKYVLRAGDTMTGALTVEGENASASIVAHELGGTSYAGVVVSATNNSTSTTATFSPSGIVKVVAMSRKNYAFPTNSGTLAIAEDIQPIVASNTADIARIDSMRDGLVHVDFRIGLGSEHDITGGLSDYTAKGFGAGDIVQIVAVKHLFPVAGRYGGQLVGDPIYNLAHDLGQDVDAYQKIEGTGYDNPAIYFIGNSNSFDPHSVGEDQEIVTTLRLSSVHNQDDATARELVASAMFNGMALSYLKEYDGFYVRVFSTDKFVKGDVTNVWWGVSAIYNFQYAGREDAYLGGLLLIGPTDFQTETTSPLDASPADNADAIERIEETIESWPEFDTGGPLFPDFCQATGLEYKSYAYCIPNGEEETHGDARLVPLVAEIAPWYDTADASWTNVKTSVEGLEPYFCDTETLYFGVPEYRTTNERNHEYPTGFYWRVLGPATGAWACAIGPYTGLTTVVRGAGQERERLWGWRGYSGTNTVREELNAQLEALAAAAIERGDADAAHAWTNWGDMLTEDSWEPRNNPIWWLDDLDTTCFSACYKTSSLATNYIGGCLFTAITRRHVIGANHYRPFDPATLRIAFVDKDGEIYWRGVSQSGLLNGKGDCWLAMLDEELPANIVPARIIHSNDFSRLRIPRTNDWPIVSHPAERGHKIEAFHMRWGGGCRSVWWDADGALSATNAYDTSTAYVTTNARPVVGSTWRYWGQTNPFIGGDSGTAIALWVDGQTIVVHTIQYANGGGPNISLLAPDIEEKIRVWGGTTETHLYWADFSAWPDYTPNPTETP